jgi:hypothetical protein
VFIPKVSPVAMPAYGQPFQHVRFAYAKLSSHLREHRGLA